MKVLNIFLLFSLLLVVSIGRAYAEPGDGTLPVIRFIEVEFSLEKLPNLPQLPRSIIIDINQGLKIMSPSRKIKNLKTLNSSYLLFLPTRKVTWLLA